jgi:hypothetical protein
MRRTPQLAGWLGNSFYLSVSLSKVETVHRNMEGGQTAFLNALALIFRRMIPYFVALSSSRSKISDTCSS